MPFFMNGAAKRYPKKLLVFKDCFFTVFLAALHVYRTQDILTFKT